MATYDLTTDILDTEPPESGMFDFNIRPSLIRICSANEILDLGATVPPVVLPAGPVQNWS